MRYGLMGVVLLGMALTEGHSLDVDVEYNSAGTSARIRIFQVPALEPLGAVKLRLKPKSGAASDDLASLAPAAGPWSQIHPVVDFSGTGITVWAIAPDIGLSRDSSAALVADLTLSLAPGRTFATAADLIDSIIVLEALDPFGAKVEVPSRMTTGLRPGGKDAGTPPVERVRGLTHTLNFSLGKAGRVRVYVVDAHGRRWVSVLDRKLSAGLHEAAWDGKAEGGSPLPAGTYFLRLEAGTYAYARKLEVAK